MQRKVEQLSKSVTVATLLHLEFPFKNNTLLTLSHGIFISDLIQVSTRKFYQSARKKPF